MMQVVNSTGKTLEEIYGNELVACPEELQAQWMIFMELHTCRQSSGFGPLAIAFSEVQAYTELMGLDLLPWEVKLIRCLDQMYLGAYHSRGKQPSGA